jgi:hypothetical protein
VYSPVADEIYLAWTGQPGSIDVFSTKTFQRLRQIEPRSGLFTWNSNRAFVDGRVRISPDGKFLFVTTGTRVVVYPTGV